MPLVCADPGHGSPDCGNVNNGRKEIEYTLPIAHMFREALERSGVKVVMTRTVDAQVLPGASIGRDLSERAAIANRNHVDLFVSWHNDSIGNPDVKGVAVFIHPSARGTKTEKIAQAIVDSIASATGQQNRGVRDGDFAVLRETSMDAVLIEGGFNTNPDESAKMATDDFKRIQAEAAAQAVCAFYGAQYVVVAPTPAPPKPTGTPIFGTAQASVQQAQAWARKRGATECFVGLAPIYWCIGAELGVRADAAYCQAAKETKFGNFGGVLDPSYHNWCGLKTTTGGGNDDPNAHMRFPDDETGVRAHIEHLALYAGRVTAAPVDPRHFASICGKAPTVEELGSKWAPNPDYGNSIVRDYLAEMAVTVVAAEPTEAEVAIKFVQDNGLIRGDETGFNGAANITREQLAVVIHRFAKKYFGA